MDWDVENALAVTQCSRSSLDVIRGSTRQHILRPCGHPKSPNFAQSTVDDICNDLLTGLASCPRQGRYIHTFSWVPETKVRNEGFTDAASGLQLLVRCETGQRS